jgi:hypothetical protein
MNTAGQRVQCPFYGIAKTDVVDGGFSRRKTVVYKGDRLLVSEIYDGTQCRVKCFGTGFIGVIHIDTILPEVHQCAFSFRLGRGNASYLARTAPHSQIGRFIDGLEET